MLRIQQCLNPSVSSGQAEATGEGHNAARLLASRPIEGAKAFGGGEENKEEFKRIKFLDRVLTNLEGHISTINTAMNRARKNERYIP